MKLTKTLLIAAIAGVVAFAANQASAFPLTLKSCSGTITVTPSYSAITNAAKAHYTSQSFNLKKITALMSNTVVHIGSNAPPANAYIAYNPYTDDIFLTNKTGYYQSLTYSGMGNKGYYCEMYVEDIATSFHVGTSSGTESDKVNIGFYFYGIGQDGKYYYAGADYGQGTLHYSGGGSKASMTINGNGVDYGELASSDDGVSKVSIVFSGSTTQPEWNGPFSLWWY